MSSLVFLLEEASSKAMLQAIVPRLVPPTILVHYLTFSGKKDLEKQMVKKIRYWCEPDTRFIILRDKDAEDCCVVKSRLLELVRQSGKADACLVRIACHELESFYLGDLAAVAQALQLPAIAGKQNKNPYRTPDNIVNAADELVKLTNKKYAKISGSRAIGPYLKLDGSNRSHSFGVLSGAIASQVSHLCPDMP